jgi:hypothetical protein
VVNPETGETITKYEQLLKLPALQKIWSAAMCKELGRLANGWENEEGTETIEFMSIDEIKEIPKDRWTTGHKRKIPTESASPSVEISSIIQEN